MENQLAVEVTLSPHFVYRAFVKDVESRGLEVSFENNWKPPCLIEFKSIRFPPKEGCDDTFKGFKSNESIEVRCKHPETHTFFWQPATLRKFNWKTSQWVLQLTKPYTEKVEVIEVPIDDIRQVNTQPTLCQSSVDKAEIEIPAHLRKIAATDGIHDDYRKQLHADTCKYILEKNILRFIARENRFIKILVNHTIHEHIIYLERKQISAAAAPSEKAKFSDVFEIEEKLMGLALGKRYANVREARKIEDVTSIELIEGTNRICVQGKTEQAVKTARDMLEYREHHFSIPAYLAEEILENDGKIIKKVIKQSGLVRVESGKDENEDDECDEEYPVVFVGNSLCIENAKVLFNYELQHADQKLKKKQTSESESVHSNDSNLVIKRIRITNGLKSLPIGEKWENVRKAEEIPGVVRIRIKTLKEPMFIIYAEHEAAAQAARRLLEYVEDTIEVEQQSLGKIIGKGGVTIKKIESLSEGVRIHIPKMTPSPVSSSKKVIITLSGPAHKIPATIELIKKAKIVGHL